MRANPSRGIVLLGNACQAYLRLATSLRMTAIEEVDQFAPSSQLDKLPEEFKGFKVICAVDTPSARIAHLVTEAKDGNRYGAGYAKDIATVSDEEAVHYLLGLITATDTTYEPTLLPQKTWLTGSNVDYVCPAILSRYANACLPNASLSHRPSADAWMSKELRELCTTAYESDSRRLSKLVMWNGDNRTPFTAFGECEPCKNKIATATKAKAKSKAK